MKLPKPLNKHCDLTYIGKKCPKCGTPNMDKTNSGITITDVQVVDDEMIEGMLENSDNAEKPSSCINKANKTQEKLSVATEGEKEIISPETLRGSERCPDCEGG